MKTVLITGASGGIGSATAKLFIKNGYRVIALYNSDENGIKKLISEVENSENLLTFKADFSNPKELEKKLIELKKSFKRVDVIVNNAGIALTKQINYTTLEEWQKLFNINTTATFLINNTYIPQMINEQSGKIINISSIWGEKGASCEVSYSASKGAIIAYTKALAKELGLSNITVNCVCPGVIDTKMNSHLSNVDIKEIENETPLNRIGKAEEVANLIYFLASDKANFITGQIITIDGGFTL